MNWTTGYMLIVHVTWFLCALLDVILVLICQGLARWIPTYRNDYVCFQFIYCEQISLIFVRFCLKFTYRKLHLLRISNDEGQLLPFLNITPINVSLNEGLSRFALSKMFWGFHCWIFILCFSSCFLFDFCCFQTWILTYFFSILSPRIIIRFKLWNLLIHGYLTKQCVKGTWKIHYLKLFVFLSWLAEKLSSMKDSDWNNFVKRVCSLLESSEKNTGAARSKLNLLYYLCTLVVRKEIANRLISSQLVSNKALKESTWFTYLPLYQKLAAFCYTWKKSMVYWQKYDVD